MLAPCKTQTRSFLDLKKKPFRISNWYLFGSKSVPKRIKIVCFTLPFVVLEFSIQERNKSIFGNIMRSGTGFHTDGNNFNCNALATLQTRLFHSFSIFPRASECPGHWATCGFERFLDALGRLRLNYLQFIKF